VLSGVPAGRVKKLENGNWKIENGKWKLENRKWKVETGK
jgi:hypothetical protein